MSQREQNIEGWRKLLAAKPAARLPDDVRFFLHKQPRVDLSQTDFAAAPRRGGRIFYIAAAAVLLMAFGITIVIRSYQNSEQQSANMAGIVLNSQGQAQVYGVEGRLPRNISRGDNLKAAEVVVTGPQSRVDLRLPGDILIRIGPDSRYRLQLNGAGQAMQIRSHLDTGSLYNIIDKQKSKGTYEVVTPTAIAGVRGTSFRVDASEKSTGLHLIEGSVEVRRRQDAAQDGSAETARQAESLILEAGEYAQLDDAGNINKSDVPEQLAADVDELADLMDVAESGGDDLVAETGLDGELKLNLSDDPEVRREQIEQSTHTRTIVLKNGQRIKGIVFSQKGNNLYVETAEKTIVIKKSQVESMIF